MEGSILESGKTNHGGKRKKISFIGVFGQQNLGNECTLQAIIHQFRKLFSNAEMNCICTVPADASKRHGIPAFPISDLKKKRMPSNEVSRKDHRLLKWMRIMFVRAPMELWDYFYAARVLKGTDALVVPGTGFLTDWVSAPFGWPYLVFKWAVVSKLCGCKLLFVSVGVGPIYQSLSRWFIKSALSLADYRSYRDSASKECMESIGFAKNSDPVYPDLAFSLPEESVSVDGNGDRRPLLVGIGLMEYYGRRRSPEEGERIYREYVAKMAQIAGWLLNHRYRVILLIGDLLYDKRVRNDLLMELEKRGVTYEKDQMVNEPVPSVEDLLEQLSRTDMVIGTRFHNVLLSLMLNKPVIAVSFHEKVDSLMADYGLQEYSQNIERLDAGMAVEQFVELEKNMGSLKRKIKNRTDANREALNEQYRLIFAIINTG